MMQSFPCKLLRLTSVNSTYKTLLYILALLLLTASVENLHTLTLKNKMMHYSHNQGVMSYVETAEVLHRYRHLPSFTAIHQDCQAAVARLNTALKDQLALKEVS